MPHSVLLLFYFNKKSFKCELKWYWKNKKNDIAWNEFFNFFYKLIADFFMIVFYDFIFQ